MIAGLAVAAALAGSAPPAAAEQWRMVWSDEFDGRTIDRRKWDFDVDCFGGGNAERQCYTDRTRNAAVRGGVLTITARRERSSGFAWPKDQRSGSRAGEQSAKPFTSARLVTRGRASWLYGRVEVRARVPGGQGSWPAIWMLPETYDFGRWPRSGEIDVMEAVNLGTPCGECHGGKENRVFGTIHFGDFPPANKYLSTETSLAGPIGDLHVYGVEWNPDRISWTVDGRRYAERKIGEWSTPTSRDPHAPFDHRFHLILNLAIGGHLPEGRNLNGVSADGFPRRMDFDWVRVWQKAAASDAPVLSKKGH